MEKHDKSDFDIKIKIKNFVLGGVFLFLSFLVAWGAIDNRQPLEYSLSSFISNPIKYGYFQTIYKELFLWTAPLTEKRYFTDYYPYYSSEPQIRALAQVNNVGWILGVYIFVFVYIYRKLKEQRHLLLTTTFTCLSIFFMYSYFGLTNESGNIRYYYLQGFCLIIFWLMFIWSLFWNGKFNAKFVGVLIVLIMYFFDVWNINRNIKSFDIATIKPRKLFQYIQQNVQDLEKDTLVITPKNTIGGYGLEFLNYISKNEIVFTDEQQNSKKAIILRWEPECNCVISEPGKNDLP